MGIRGIEESSVYQSIFAKGRAERIAEALISLGQNSLGVPDERVKDAIMGMTDRDRLHRLIGRLPNVSTWEELLAPEES